MLRHCDQGNVHEGAEYEKTSSLFYGADENNENGPFHHYYITTKTLTAKVLKYTYLCTSARMMDYISLRVDRATLIELRKIKFDNLDELTTRPQLMKERIKDVERPASWTYWDDEIPIWCKGWEQMETKRIEKLLGGCE